MSESIIKKIAGVKAGRAVLGSIAAGAVATVGLVMAKRWVARRLADGTLERTVPAVEEERQRPAAEAEEERQRLASLSEQERQRAAEQPRKADQTSLREAARAALAWGRAAGRRELESRVGRALNQTFQRLGLNLRAELRTSAPETPPAAANPAARAK